MRSSQNPQNANFALKLSEKSWRCPNRGLTRVRMGTFRTVSEGEFCEVEPPIYGVLGSSCPEK
jgi:hypothetical protein